MVGRKGKSGGKRKNSGRKSKNQTWGPPVNRSQGLLNHFTPARSQTQANSTAQNPQNEVQVPLAELPPLPPSPPPSPRRSRQPQPPTPTPTTVREDSVYPNMDIEDDVLQVGENVSTKGKRISGCKNLQIQRETIMSPTYFDKAVQNITSFGQLWDHPPSIVKDMSLDLESCWLAFFKLPIFNWIPEHIIGNDWKPKCPHCNKCLAKNGRTNPPRLVFGQNKNYWLNAPQRYVCTACDRENKTLPEDRQKKVSYTATSSEILKQIEITEPEVMDMFPCHLSHRNAVDKDLMNLVVHGAAKGVGPSAMADNITSWHELQWQKQENQWARYLLKRLNQPTVTQRNVPRNEIEKCPGYFSQSMGGCVPSGQYLVDMFCKIIEEDRDYLDSEMIKRLKTTLHLAIDASYKVPKWMMTHGEGQRLYEALLSGTNEYNEVPMQVFATSDNHDELGATFENLAALGLNPKLAFSDDPGRDERLLKHHFPRLRTPYDDDDNKDEDSEEKPEGMPDFSTRKKIHYVYEIDKVNLALNQFIEDLDEAIQNTAERQVKVSFDAEWPVFKESLPGNTEKKVPGDVNILQLGSNVVEYSILLELYNFRNRPQDLKRIGQKLKAIFSLNVSCFVGCNHKADYDLLLKQYPMFELPKEAKSKMEDVSWMAVNRGVAKNERNKRTLKALCKGQNLWLPKPKHVQVGICFNTTSGLLPPEAQVYCQLDVEAPLILHQIYMGMVDLTRRINRTAHVDVGTTVDIMPESSRSIEPIAQGVVTQVGGNGSVWGRGNVKIRKDQVLVDIKKVFNPKGIIHYPHTSRKAKACDCGRPSHNPIRKECDFYLYSQYGPPTFQVIELKSRLRKFNETIEYPQCVYANGNNPEAPSQLSNFSLGQVRNYEDEEDSDGDSVIPDATEDDHHEAADNEARDLSPEDEDLENLPPIPEELRDRDYDDDEEILEGNPTPKEIRIATEPSFDETLNKIIEEADKLAEALNATEECDDDLLAQFRTVLGDMFHFMDRAKLPMHHEYKALFFRALRAASFIMVKEDVENVKNVLRNKPGQSWEKKLAFDFGYIAQRVRRKVPPPNVLYHRMKAVYDFFCDKIDSKTNVPLFNDRAKNKFNLMLEMVRRGYASDPPDVKMYTPKTDKFGRKMIDRDGLVLYRSLRGTNNLESLHQLLTTSFGHTMAGPHYSDLLLTILRHMNNWRQSRRNRPNFPNLGHYDGKLIDRINSLYELIFGHRKYVDWSPFNENLPTRQAFGIVPVKQSEVTALSPTDSDKELVAQSSMLSYIARRQGSPLPFLPIRGENEKRLVHRMLSEIIRSNRSLNSQTLYEDLATQWNTHEVNISQKIFPKLPCHFSKYVKQWSKNQDRRNAAIGSGSHRLSNALEYVPGLQADGNFEAVPVDFSTRTNDPTEDASVIATHPTDDTIVEPPTPSPPPAPGVLLLCNVCENSTEVQPTRPPVRPPVRKRSCKMVVDGIKCPDPYNCRGKNNRKNCMLIIKGDITKLSKRTIVNKTKPRCAICKSYECIGITMRARCPSYSSRNNE